MDGFSYSDIFATKGMEYLVIIAFLAMLIPFWMLLNRQAKMAKQIQTALGALTASALKIPQGVFFSGNHTWMFLEKNGKVRIGLDDLLLHLTGKVEFSFLHNPGKPIRKGGLLAVINQNGKLLKIYSPVSGEIMETNSMLNDSNGFLNEDPYGKGWVYKIKPSFWRLESKSCYVADEATRWSENELNRFKDFLSRTMKSYTPETATIIMQDGGELCDHSLSSLPNEIWKDFQTEFLNSDRMKMTEV